MNPKKCPIMWFDPDTKIISHTFRITDTLVFYVPIYMRERERERKRERGREGERAGAGERDRERE